jgi:DNA-binding transcriptional regulator YhcF (GntR family)
MIGDQGFAAVPNFVWRMYAGPLALFCLLRYRADNRTGESWWSHEAMAADLGVSRATVMRWLQKLEDAGHVTVERRVTEVGQTSNLYTVAGVANLQQPGVAKMQHELTNNTQLQLTESQLQETKKGYVSFDAFWDVYPRRAGKQAARKAWDKAVKVTPAVIVLAGAAAFRDDPNREDEFTPHPATWLNQGRWDDDPLPARAGRKTTGEARDDELSRVLRSAMEYDQQQQRSIESE